MDFNTEQCLHIYICEDDVAWQKRIIKAIDTYNQSTTFPLRQVKIALVTDNPLKFLEVTKASAVHSLFFLDQHLKHDIYDGLFISAKLRRQEKAHNIVFVSSDRDTASKALSDFIHPFSYIDKAFSDFETRIHGVILKKLDIIYPLNYDVPFIVKGCPPIHYDNIVGIFREQGHYLMVHYLDNNKILTAKIRERVVDLDAKLAEDCPGSYPKICLVDRSNFVNLSKIEHYCDSDKSVYFPAEWNLPPLKATDSCRDNVERLIRHHQVKIVY